MKFKAKFDWWIQLIFLGFVAANIWGIAAAFTGNLGGIILAVTIQGDSMHISAMYGTRVELTNIADIALLDLSMREIGVGRRTNGYNGGAWRGNFTAGLLFVRPDSSPTIRIDRHRGSAIFISFRDTERTELLYIELSSLGIGNP
ncbi:MAG: hypothetical protein FWC13_03875 [Oscillospiraceae bacterium]|nr:hypothetical protein [Oscillospiraceae bacterium]